MTSEKRYVSIPVHKKVMLTLVWYFYETFYEISDCKERYSYSECLSKEILNFPMEHCLDLKNS